MLRVKLPFFVYWGKPVFDLLDKVQFAVAPRVGATEGLGHPRMHRVYSLLTTLLANLNDSSSHCLLVNEVLHALPNKDKHVYKLVLEVALTPLATKIEGGKKKLAIARYVIPFASRLRSILGDEVGIGIETQKPLFRLDEITCALHAERQVY